MRGCHERACDLAKGWTRVLFPSMAAFGKQQPAKDGQNTTDDTQRLSTSPPLLGRVGGRHKNEIGGHVRAQEQRVESALRVAGQGAPHVARVQPHRAAAGRHAGQNGGRAARRPSVHFKVAVAMSARPFSGGDAPAHRPDRAPRGLERAGGGIVSEKRSQQKEQERVDVRCKGRVSKNAD